MEAGADDAGFEAYAAARWSALVRSAVFLGCTLPEAEDVVQETLTRCFVSWRKVTAARQRDAYVARMLVNAFHDSHRRGWRRERAVAVVPERSTPDPSFAVDDTAVVEAALGGLSTGQREVLVLRFWLQLTEAQTADALGVALGTVKSRTARALEALAADPHLIELHDGGTP